VKDRTRIWVFRGLLVLAAVEFLVASRALSDELYDKATFFLLVGWFIAWAATTIK
jgi:hypothetical protein